MGMGGTCPLGEPALATSISSSHLQHHLGLVSAAMRAQKGLFHCKIWWLLLFVISWLNPLLAFSLFARGVLAFSPKRMKELLVQGFY